MRKKLLLGNWKMNKTIAEAKDFALQSIELSKSVEGSDVLIGVAPTYLSLDVVRKTNPNIIVAAQNVHYETSGAFTGEISIPMLKEIGVTWAIIGHSERRSYDNETSTKCNLKIRALLSNEMTPVYCVGETLEEYEADITKEIIRKQIVEGLDGLCECEVKRVVIAYEPVWSIGTGKNASKEIAEDICSFIRENIRAKYPEIAEEVLILYGGSVKPENIKSYLGEPSIDGALVGGASLKVESYKALIEEIL